MTSTHDQAGSHDGRHVVLIKSLATNNRFYALVTEESGIRNADTIERIPPDLLLGIAYPCLEDGLNDFAVIRTTFETLDLFTDDPEMRDELMEIISDAREKLRRRLAELRDRIADRTVHFLGGDLEEFRSFCLDLVHRGYPRRNLDNMMKLNVFTSVAELEAAGGSSEPAYRYEFRTGTDVAQAATLPAREFIVVLMSDILDSVLDDTNYADRFTFDRNVFQKFIAVMFVNYATTDPIFYGTNKADYGVSSDKDMDATPLYQAVGRQLRAIEAWIGSEAMPDLKLDLVQRQPEAPLVNLDVSMVNEDAIMGHVASICAAARQLAKQPDRETAHFARVIIADASRLVRELKSLGIVSNLAEDPTVDG